MSIKVIQTTVSPLLREHAIKVQVLFDSDLDEYCVTVMQYIGNSKATHELASYYTDDEEDALGTCKAMVTQTENDILRETKS